MCRIQIEMLTISFFKIDRFVRLTMTKNKKTKQSFLKTIVFQNYRFYKTFHFVNDR